VQAAMVTLINAPAKKNETNLRPHL
jgi:hypothetical protein